VRTGEGAAEELFKQVVSRAELNRL
jgi:hypothetical protein